MDTLTHALSGALLARATAAAAPERGAPSLRERMSAGFVAAAFPDSDFVLRAVDSLAYLGTLHQGPTHSLLLLPLWALGLALVFGRLCGRRWRAFYAPAALGIAIHIAADAITAYGTQLLFPLSGWRASLSLAFVIDPYFTAILVAGLLVAWLLPSKGRPVAAAALLVLAGYVGLLAALHQRAVGIGIGYAQAQGLAAARSHALPQPLSPFHWKVIVSDDYAYHEALVDLQPGPSLVQKVPLVPPLARMAAAYRTMPQWRLRPLFGHGAFEIALAREAWEQDTFREFRRFARFPALYRIDAGGDGQCVWFVDLRFTLPERKPSFVFGLCRTGPGAEWQLRRERGPLWID